MQAHRWDCFGRLDDTICPNQEVNSSEIWGTGQKFLILQLKKRDRERKQQKMMICAHLGKTYKGSKDKSFKRTFARDGKQF